MPNFTIYVTGGGDYFYTTLNGVAMIFNDGDLVRSVIFMGSMFALLTGAWYYIQKNVGSGLMKSHTWLEHAIVMVILSFLAFVPTRVTVQDIYGQQNVTPIDNVPLIFALPASIFSGVNHDIFRAIDTAYQSTTGSTMAVSENGFVTPLKLMLSMRGGLQQVAPEAYQSWFNYIGSCLYNTASTTGGMSQSADVATFLTQNGKDGGFVKVFLRQSGSGIAAVQDGVVVTCAEAKTLLDLRMDALFASGTGANPSSDVDRLINQNMGEANRNSVNGRWSWSDAMTAANGFQLEVGASAQSAQQYMKNSLMRSVVVDAFGCAANYLSAADQMLCTQSMHDSMEQYKVDAAGRGSWFSNMMLPAMTILQLLFFAFSVVAFLYGIIRGAGAVSFIGKYFLFGAWVFSWLPFVAIINAFINWMVVDKMRMSSLQALTIENYDSYFSGLQSSLALASDLLAATPLITLGFMTGSMFALSSFAQRLSNNDYMKEQNVAPNTVDVAPVMKHDSAYQSNNQTGTRDAGTVYEQVRAGDALGAAVESRRMEAQASQLQTTDQFSHMFNAMKQVGGSTRITNSDGTTANISEGEMFQAGLRKMRSHVDNSQFSASERADVQSRAEMAAKLMGSGLSFSASWQKAMDGAENKNVQDALENMLSGASTYASNAGRQVASAIQHESLLSGTDAESVASGFSKTVANSEALTKSYSEVSTRAQTIDSSKTADVSVLGSIVDRDRALGTSGKGIDRKINDAYNELRNERGAEAVDGQMQQKLRAWTDNGGNFRAMTEMAQLQTLQAMGRDVAYANIVADLFSSGPSNIGDATALKGVSGSAASAQPQEEPNQHRATVAQSLPGAGNGHASLKSLSEVKDQAAQHNDVNPDIKNRVAKGMEDKLLATADGVMNHNKLTPKEARDRQLDQEMARYNLHHLPKDESEYKQREIEARVAAKISGREPLLPIPPASVQQDWMNREISAALHPSNVHGDTPQEREANAAQAAAEARARVEARIADIYQRNNEAARSQLDALSPAAGGLPNSPIPQAATRPVSDAREREYASADTGPRTVAPETVRSSARTARPDDVRPDVRADEGAERTPVGNPMTAQSSAYGQEQMPPATRPTDTSVGALPAAPMPTERPDDRTGAGNSPLTNSTQNGAPSQRSSFAEPPLPASQVQRPSEAGESQRTAVPPVSYDPARSGDGSHLDERGGRDMNSAAVPTQASTDRSGPSADRGGNDHPDGQSRK